MATMNRLIFNPVSHRVMTNPFVYHLLFTSFVTKRFATQTKMLSGDDWLFLNYGYEEDPPMAVPLDASDEANRFFIQQYHRTAAQVDLAGKKVLEVSCGHGGGASYVARTFKPASYTGLDLNETAIEFCRERHQLPGMDFVQGDAEDLPFDDGSFDVVFQVEASHLYPHPARFFNGAARVLAPGGHFLYTDFRRRSELAQWDAELADTGLRLVAQEDISMAVLRGNEKNLARKQDMIAHHGGLARFASAATDWTFNGALKNGEFVYRLYDFVKD